MEIRVLLVDDFPLVRAGIAAALETDNAINVMGQGVVTIHGGGTVIDAALAAQRRSPLRLAEDRPEPADERPPQDTGLGRRSELAHWAATHLG